MEAVPVKIVPRDWGETERQDAWWIEAILVVVVFSSSTCHTCADVVAKSKVLACDDVGVYDAEYTAHKDLHRKYAVEAVPLIAVADADGVVHAGFAGPVTATDLWAAVAEVRNPGSSPEPHLGR